MMTPKYIRAVLISTGVRIFSANNTNYETSQRKPVTQETDDETSQEDSSDDNENDSDDSGETNEFEEDKNCTCSRSSCTCCINLNLSFIDLGGPGDVLRPST